jgi:hypothetical protein
MSESPYDLSVGRKGFRMRGTRHLRLQEQQLHEALKERLTERRSGVETLTVNLKNTVTCFGCGETITSLTRHDFQTCKCGAISVDGGFDYVKRSAAPGAQWEEWAGAFERDAAAAEALERSAAVLADPSWRTTLFRAGGARS